MKEQSSLQAMLMDMKKADSRNFSTKQTLPNVYRSTNRLLVV
jgi:hypothetical protein